MSGHVAVCEGPSDWRALRVIVDRAVPSQDGKRPWLEVSDGAEFLSWANAAHLAREARIKVAGSFGGQPVELEAKMALRAIQVCITKFGQRLRAIVMLRDADDSPDRIKGLLQGRDQAKLNAASVSVAVGQANPSVDGWVLAAIGPNRPQKAPIPDAKRRLSQVCPDVGAQVNHMQAVELERWIEWADGSGLGEFVADLRQNLP